MSALDSLYKQYVTKGGQTPSVEPEKPKDPLSGPLYTSPFQAGIANVEKAGGAMLNSTLKGLTFFGQAMLGTMEALEDEGNYDMFWKPDEKGNIRFQWDAPVKFFDTVTSAGGEQAMRSYRSENLSELMQNTVTGVDILKKMPGGIGEFFSNDDTQAKRIGTGIAGLALEILLDPAAVVGGAVGTATRGALGQAAKAGVMGDRAADVIGRIAGSTASGNFVAGPIATGIRESAWLAREKVAKVANTYGAESKRGRIAGTFLEWAMGPSALATNQEMKTVLAKYAALKEDLPKEMLRVANTAATLTAKIPVSNRREAQRQFSVLASASDEASEIAALETLEKLGIRRAEAAAVGTKFREANLRMIDIVTDAKGTLPGFDVELSQYHLRRSYRMFVDPKVRSDWLDYLVKANTPASWQFRQTDMRSQLMDGLLIPGTVRKIGGPINEGFSGRITTDQLRSDNWAVSKRVPLEERLVVTGVPNNLGSVSDDLNYTGGGGAMGDNTPVTDPLPKGTGRTKFDRNAERLTKAINVLDERINVTDAGPRRDKLIDAKNKYQAQLDMEIATRPDVPPIVNEGSYARNAIGDNYEGAMYVGRQDAVDVTDAQIRGAQLADGDMYPKVPKDLSTAQVRAEMVPNINSAGTLQGPALPSGMAGRLKDELLPGEKGLVVAQTSNKVKLGTRQAYLDDFEKFIAEDDAIKQSSFVGFETVDGIPTAKFGEIRAGAKQKTLDDIREWATNWGNTKGLDADDTAQLIKATVNNIAYVPGSKEFQSLVRTRNEGLRDIDPHLQRLVSAEMGSTLR